MAAMHEDDSPDLQEVGRILRDVLEVEEPCTSFHLFSFYSYTIDKSRFKTIQFLIIDCFVNSGVPDS